MAGSITLANEHVRIELCERGGCTHVAQHGLFSPICHVDGCPCGESPAYDERVFAAVRVAVLEIGPGWIVADDVLRSRGIAGRAELMRVIVLTADEHLCQQFGLMMLAIGMAAGIDALSPRGLMAFVADAVARGTIN